MKSILKLSVMGGGTYGGYLYYRNFMRSTPPDPKLHEKKDKKIVVLGAGIIGLSTAYYLS
jgi:hypothetical protein